VNSHRLLFTVAFNYSPLARASSGVLVPAILRAHGISTRMIRVRVDSASTYCVFGQQWALALGLDWGAGDPMTISTAAGGFVARLHNVAISLLGWEWTTPVAFAEWHSTPPSPARDVLGLNGFFDRFLIAIDYQAEILYLEARF
jgi:hypothetical protein